MIVRPIHNILLLPDVTYYFKKDFLVNWSDSPVEAGQDILFLLLQEDKKAQKLAPEDFYPIGISACIESIDDEDNVQVRTMERVDISDIEIKDGKMTADAAIRGEIDDFPREDEKLLFDQLRRALLKFVQGYQWGVWARSYILQRKSMNDLACSLTDYLNLTAEEKYQILAQDSRRQQCEMIAQAIYEFIEISNVSAEAQNAQKDDQEQLYREIAIKKQIDYLQRELDEMHPENVSDVRRFEKKINDSGMNEEAYKEAMKVLNRMKQEGNESHEYGMLYDYLDFMTSLSWKQPSSSPIDLEKAQKVLDEDHHGLKKVKERIIQQIAVMDLNKKQSGSILLFVGAPGSGKTSIGQSIARALDRAYVRISLGGVRDEAEIRGHRRTYIGAMPGRIMEGIKRSGSSNPVVVLDEVDKLSHDYSGDPSSALLEVLDPEQNFSFTDHYLNVPYDLSNVLFVCTANSTDTIPEPLLNRMEVISFQGYTALEKFQIGKKHLLPKAMEATGIKKDMLKVTDAAMRRMIDEYTMESGVRSLKKLIDTLCRSAAVKLVKKEQTTLTVTKDNLSEFLGHQHIYHDKKLKTKIPGVVTGLAWTSAGGEILFIESKLMEGKGELIITGQLGDVMKESVRIALSLVRSMYPQAAKKLAKHDLHIHVPAGAVPKDGPSAGITLVTALASLITGKAVDTEYAMTGEVSLRGGVMPIGGLPEKLMAAQRAGITKVFIPYDNIEDLEEVADEVKEKLEIIPVRKVTEVLNRVLA